VIRVCLHHVQTTTCKWFLNFTLQKPAGMPETARRSETLVQKGKKKFVQRTGVVSEVPRCDATSMLQHQARSKRKTRARPQRAVTSGSSPKNKLSHRICQRSRALFRLSSLTHLVWGVHSQSEGCFVFHGAKIDRSNSCSRISCLCVSGWALLVALLLEAHSAASTVLLCLCLLYIC